MNRIDSYGVYQKDYYQNGNRQKAQENAPDTKQTQAAVYEKSREADGTGRKQEVQLSDKARKLLEDLKKKYGNMDFIVADYGSDEEAARYLSGGQKEYSILIEPELLEEMAADKGTREKYEKVIQDSTGRLKEMAKQLGNDADKVKNLGIAVDKDGGVSFFAELEKLSGKQRERIESSRDQKKEEAKASAREEAADRKKEKLEDWIGISNQGIMLKDDTAEGLLFKIKNFDFSEWNETQEKSTGNFINYMV